MPGKTVHLPKVKGVHGLSRKVGVISECLLADIQNWKSILHVLAGGCGPSPFPG